MEFLILGPLEVRRDGMRLPLGAAKQRVLLALFLLHANEVVSRDRLVDDLWGAQPPETAGNALQVYVSQLRKALEPGRGRGVPPRIVLTRPGGYMLRMEPGGLDAERFERLLSQGASARMAGEAEAASQRLAEALELWRGPALADFTYEPFAQAEIARLEELRVAALEERIEADLALGRQGLILAELEALVREHPLRERLRAQLMLAMYRSGRQADALEVYQDAHRTLTDELGIHPGPELQRLQAAILRQDPDLEPRTEVTSARLVVERPPPEPAPAAPEMRKTVTVVVTGWTAPTGTDPEARRGVDERRHATASATLERHGGRVDAVVGDRLVAVFGVPRIREDDALRAARAAIELRDSAPTDAEQPAASTGIATGEVVAGSDGASITGDVLTLAEQLQNSAAPGEIVLSGETRALLAKSALLEHADVLDRHAWRLREMVPSPPPLMRVPETPIVGRARELEQLWATLERTAQERTAHLFTVLGPAGIGKSRLGEELASRAAGRATVAAGRCVAYGEGITFWPLREIVGQLSAGGPLSPLLDHEHEPQLIADRIAEAIGRGHATTSVEEIFWAFRALFRGVARKQPLVLLFEDLHWAEPTLLDFIDYLVERERSAPILVLCLARPELLEDRPGWGGGKPNASSSLLEPLTQDESSWLVNTLAPSLPSGVRSRAEEIAEGNPLFLEQILSMLKERGAPEGDFSIPPTIQAVLAARLDRLGPGERALIERAAVVGREFWRDAVVELLPDDARPFAARHLEALVVKELLQPARSLLPREAAFRFRHVLIQQATYRAIPKRGRAGLHRRVADWLDRRFGRGTPEYDELAGYHLEQTYRYRAEFATPSEDDREVARHAAALLASAGRRAFRRGDMRATVNLLGRAVSLLAPDEHAALELLPDLGYAVFEVGELERADRLLTDAIESARARGEAGIEWNAIVKRTHARMYSDPSETDPEQLVRETTRGIETFEGLGDDLGLARAWSLLSDANWPRGRMADAAAAAQRAAEHARRAGSRREEAWGLGAYAFALLYGPVPADEGARRTDRLVQEAAGNLVLEANLSGFLAALEGMSGDFDAARSHIDQSCQRLRDLGLVWQAGVQELLWGYIELFAGAPATAERHMRAARDSFVAIGDRWSLSTVSVDLPRPVYEQGRYEEARALVAAIDDTRAPHDREWQIKRRGVRARLLAREGRLDEGEALAREAVAVAAGTDLLWFHADSLMDLAEVLSFASRREQAVGAAQEALVLYEKKGNVASAARARAVLREMSA